MRRADRLRLSVTRFFARRYLLAVNAKLTHGAAHWPVSFWQWLFLKSLRLYANAKRQEIQSR